MKKTLAILGAVIALLACSKVEQIKDDTVNTDRNKINVNITVTRTEEDVDTKATVKKEFENGDVIFVFFKGIAAPKHLKLVYSSESWSAEQMGGLVAGDFTGNNRLEAIYMPYGASYSVSADGSNFVIKDAEGNDYNGLYYVSWNESDSDYRPKYSWNSTTNTLSCSISLVVPVSSPNKLVHFDISSGFISSHTYTLYQDYVYAKTLKYISIGAAHSGTSTLGEGIRGHYDSTRGILSFSGMLKGEGVIGNDTDFEFFIRDETTGELYFFDAQTKNFPDKNLYVGLPALNNDSKWKTPTSKAFSVSAEKTVDIASRNLSYRGTEENKWQLMKYPWSRIEYLDAKGSTYNYSPTAESEISLMGWATSGYNSEYPYYIDPDNTKYGPSGLEDGNDFGRDWDWGSNTIYKYGGSNVLSGTWRTPTKSDWLYLFGAAADGSQSDTHPRYNLWGRAVINDVNGVVLIPDTFTDPQSTTTSEGENKSFNNGGSSTVWGESGTASNYYTIPKWNKMEYAGAIFLPVAGNTAFVSENTIKVQSYNVFARYWSSTAATYTAEESDVKGVRAYCIDIQATKENFISNADRQKGRAVRLIRDLK